MFNEHLSDTHFQTDWFRKNFLRNELYQVDSQIIDANFLKGSNKKGVLVVIASPGTDIDASAQDQLNKILLFLKLSAEDIHLLIVTRSEPISLGRIFSENVYQKVIVFGIKPAKLQLHVQFSINQPVHFSDKEWLFTYSLDELNTDAMKKKSLVEPLKKLFNVA